MATIAAGQDPAPIRTARSAELRLALVCYGGVSLAVYMHGVTKELHKLVRASRRFDEMSELDGTNPFDADATEAAYFEALREIARETGRRLSVSIDIIAGTSAGGINGVVLAKAIARDADQEALRRLWIDEGDLKKLLRAPRLGPVLLRGVVAAVRQLLRLDEATSPLRGEMMSQLLVRALGDMDGVSGTTLVPPGGELQLYVTTTDLTGLQMLVPSGAGGASQRDRSYAQVLEFRAATDDTAEFGPAGNLELAFAGRATASFPGAFAPVSLTSFREEASTGPILPRADLFRFPYDETEDGRGAHDAQFTDGGVLDNAPFDLVIDAIARRPAQTEVLRRLVYIQPDPGRPLEPATGAAFGRPAPGDTARPEGWLATLWRVAGSVRSSHPLVKELLRLRDLNLRISAVGTIADREMQQVLPVMKAVVAAAGLDVARIDSEAHARAVGDAMHARAEAALGPAYATYQRLKVEAAGRRLADEIASRFVFPPGASRASFVRAAIGEWARSREEWTSDDPARLVALLGPVDLPYRERRLLFMLAGVNRLYGIDRADAPPSGDLDRLKAAAWELLQQLHTVAGSAVNEVPAEVVGFLSAATIDRWILQDPKVFAAAHAAEFEQLFLHYRDALVQRLGDGGGPIWRIFEARTSSWSPSNREELLFRYLGFPLWDGLIFPVISYSELPQFTPIGVSQFSPLAATVLETPAGGKLRGVVLDHFGAFLRVDWRENDYLWGRLDGAELILRTLYDTRGGPPPDASAGLAPDGREAQVEAALQAAGGRHLVAALRAVLASEQDLGSIAGIRRDLRAEVDRLDRFARDRGDPGDTRPPER